MRRESLHVEPRGTAATDRWWVTGLETLVLGAIVAGAAYRAGRLVVAAASL